MERVVSLLRASTKKQTDQNTKDIPSQRQIVNDFIEKNGWELVKEFVEGDVSGYKISANDRDKLQEIKAMAIKKEFDILVVYMSDRLGRISDETPLVVRFLNEQGVKVLSVTEGEIKSDTHTDKLITYIRYWQSEGESLKTSIRVTDYQIALVKRGGFRGGSYIPFGYELVNTGRKNYKGRNILDFKVNQEEAEIVKLIYDLSLKMNYGQNRTAKYLNENHYKNRSGKGWYSSTIQSILKNPIYKGQFHIYSKLYNKLVLSQPIKDLMIITPEEWEDNRKAVEARTIKKVRDPEYDKRNKNTHGKLLLSGLAYCGYCGSRLTTMTAYKRWTLADGTKKKGVFHKYRCGSFYKKGAIKCDGQSTYGVTKLEPLVIEETKQFIQNLQKKDAQEEYIKNVDRTLTHYKDINQQLENNLSDEEQELSALKSEISKALLGKSIFSQEDLKEAIENKSEIISKLEEEIHHTTSKVNDLMAKRDSHISLDKELFDWDNKFEEMDFEGRKAMLAAILNKVIVRKDSIEIEFNVKLETYKENVSCSSTRLVRVPR